ncbi:MAG: hypothetical protein ACRC0S_09675 [Fusobacteriaceae bacterium]
MAKLKSVIVAHKAQMSGQIPGGIDCIGMFDNMIQPVYPHPLHSLSIVLTFEKILKPVVFEIRINSPTDELITMGEFVPMIDPFGVGKKILDLEKVLIKDRGIYTIDIFEKNGKEVNFLESANLFIADYPPQRQFTPEMIEEILKAEEGIIKLVKTEFRPLDNPEKIVKIQISLDKNVALEEGYIPMPENDKIVIEEKEYDLTGVRRQVEWMYGNPIPKPEENKEEIGEKNQEEKEEEAPQLVN